MLRWRDPDHSGTDHGLAIDDLSISYSIGSTPTPTPVLSTNGTLTPFSTTNGTASAAQSVTVNGTNLTANITATAPASFEISTVNATSGFGSNATIPQSGGNASGTLFVRLAASAPVGTPSGNITLSSTNAITVNVAVNGTVSAPPAGAPVVTGASFNGTVGVAFSQNVTATNGPNTFSASVPLPAGLTLNATTGAITGTPTAAGNSTLVITATNNATLSGNASFTFAIARGTPTITTPPTASPIREGQVLGNSTLTGGNATGIGGAALPGSFAFTNPGFEPTSAGNSTYSVTFTPTDSGNWTTTTANVAVTVTAAPKINLSATSLGNFTTTTLAPSANQTLTVNGTTLEGPVIATAPAGYEISTDGVSYSANLTLSPSQSAAPVARAATVIASDNAADAAYIDGWGNGDNGGTGFLAWQTPGSPGTGGFNGFFVGTANATLFPNHAAIYTSGNAFSIYAGGSDAAFQDATRPFASTMQPGMTLSHSLAFSFDNGNKGFSLLSGGSEVFNFNINGSGYTWTGGNASMTSYPGVRERGVVINFIITRTVTGFDYSFSSPQDSNLTRNGTVTTSGIDTLKYYISGAGGGDGGNIYFNNLQITSSATTGGNLTNTTIYVRLAGNGTVGSKLGNLTFTSTNATTKQVALSGTVNPPPPVLNVSTASLPAFSTLINTASSPASFTVNGSYLTENVSVAAPSGFEVSTSNSTGFGSGVILVPSGGTLATSTLFARLAAQGNATTSPLTGNITLTSGNASATVGVSGQVFDVPPGPFIRPGNSTVSIPLAIAGEASSAAGPVVVDGFSLTENLTVAAPAGIEISTTANGTFSSSLAFAPDNQGFVQSKEMFIRVSASAPLGTVSSNVTLSSAGAETKTITVSRTVFAKPLLAASTASLSGFATRTGEGPSSATAFTLNATNLLGNVTLTAPAGFEISTADNFSTQVVLPAGNGTFSTSVSVRLSASGTKSNPAGNLTISSDYAQPLQIALSGIVRGPATISVTPASLSSLNAAVGNASASQTLSVTGVDLYGPIQIEAPQGFEISRDGVTFSSSLQITSNATSGDAALLAVDAASNYSAWGNGTNSGWGFSSWLFNVVEGTGFAGAFIGNPADAGITNLPNPSFGLYANPGGSGANATVSRTLTQAMQVGDSFSFQWATNWDSDVGNKGFNVFAGGNQVVNVNQAGFPGDITLNGQTAIEGSAGYGTQPMTWTFTRTTATNLLVTSTDRKGNAAVAFSANVTISAAPDGFGFYTTAMGSGDQRQPYFNNFRQTSSTVFAGDIDATVHVRLAASNSIAQFSGNLVVLSPLAETRTVPLSGETFPPPTLDASPRVLGGLATKVDDVSNPYRVIRSFTVNGSDLFANVTVTPPPDIELSSDNSTFSAAPLTLAPSGGQMQQAVYVRIATSAAPGLYQGNAAISTPGAQDVLVSLNGSALDDSTDFQNPDLGDALGTGNDLNFDWTTSGHVPWFVQSNETVDGVEALQSGPIANGQRSTVQTALVGSGRLTFQWKVSSSATNGRLILYINGAEAARLSGQTGWEEKSILLPARASPHTVRFDYIKGASGAAGGMDAAWLDEVSFVPFELAPQIAVEYGGSRLSIPGGTIPFSIQGLTGNQTRTVTVRNIGTSPLVLGGTPTVFGSGFSASTNSSQLTLATGETFQVGISSTPAAYPSWSGSLIITSNDPENPSVWITLQGAVTLSALEDWRGRKFFSPPNSGNAANSADPDFDGIPNLLEYAFGLEPWIRNPSPPVPNDIVSNGSKRHLRLYIDRRRDDLNYIVESSTDLNVWNPVKTYEGIGTESAFFEDTSHDLNAPSQPRRFLRVRVTER